MKSFDIDSIIQASGKCRLYTLQAYWRKEKKKKKMQGYLQAQDAIENNPPRNGKVNAEQPLNPDLLRKHSIKAPDS